MKSVLLLLVSSTALAQADLKSFLDAAESANVDQRITVEARNRAAAEYRAAWSALLPSLTAQAGWTHNQYDAVTQFPDSTSPTGLRELVIIPKNQLDASLRFELPLIDTQRWIRAASAGVSNDSAELREQVTKDQVRRQVVAAYYGYAAALATQESAKKSAGVAEAQLKLMEIRTQAGATTELDLSRARSEMQRTRQMVADAAVLASTSRRTLRTLTGIEAPGAMPEWQDNLSPEAPLEELEGRIDALPAVQAADKDASATELAATGAGLALVPTVAANFTQRFTNATGFQGRDSLYTAGVTATWRLDAPTFMNMGVVNAAASQARLAVEKTKLAARDQVNADWQRLNAALIKIDAAKAQVESAQRAAQVSKDRYAVGSATQVDVIQAERDLFGAEVAQISARTELATARASLRLSAALPLE